MIVKLRVAAGYIYTRCEGCYGEGNRGGGV
jgi:hypothetical protein